MIILNLGCGTKASDHLEVVNIDWSIMLRLKKNQILWKLISSLVDANRRQRLDAIPNNILVHDLAKGIPFPNQSIDVVYHSHMLEHLDREVAEGFLSEVLRVLKPGGIHRIVIPDFEDLCRRYLSHVVDCSSDMTENSMHDEYISEIIEQSVRREAYGTSQQRWFRRKIENLILGDARKRGETHQWMYDRINLSYKLIKAGYHDISIHKFNTSSIPGWNEIALDLDSKGCQYKPGSLYLEACS